MTVHAWATVTFDIVGEEGSCARSNGRSDLRQHFRAFCLSVAAPKLRPTSLRSAGAACPQLLDGFVDRRAPSVASAGRSQQPREVRRISNEIAAMRPLLSRLIRHRASYNASLPPPGESAALPGDDRLYNFLDTDDGQAGGNAGSLPGNGKS